MLIISVYNFIGSTPKLVIDDEGNQMMSGQERSYFSPIAACRGIKGQRRRYSPVNHLKSANI
ncbi:hypothetical protein Back11_03290 [Paenibacillus baekrokdamisoli]|uniref:Uncharacterized protein n=1 Tax=Paenibacillus baekrokdamisoli TaxID=1712516 RepID=A0A3G9J6J1_9BACL|nr:hypothetical protein Back11_03290 [Paenibacillus baekrokdamisoli]